MANVIEVKGLSKAYQLGEISTGTLSSDLHRWWSKVRGKEDPFLKIGEDNDRTIKGNSNVVWSLQDINFEIEQGEAIGIIGRNGAGKSTLLKLLSRVTSPTEGVIKAHGRIASLLEVGTGFHPDLTGRENIYLNGAILGMRKKEITRRFDEIVDFSGVERYIDTPVKRYSSGMYVRLAFAVAAHLESEILIVDEVLAVGDAEFQKKCLGKMGEVSKGEGRTVLFVSHNMDAILRLCSSCIFLKNGKLKQSGNSDKIIGSYLSTEAQLSSYVEYKNIDSAPGNENVKLLECAVINVDGNNKTNFAVNEKIGIKIVFCVLTKTKDLLCGFNLYTQRDVHILSSHDVVNNIQNYEPGIYQTVVWIPPNLLAEGIHYCGIAAISFNPLTIHFHDVNKLAFNIVDSQLGENIRAYYTGDIPGIIHPLLQWDILKKI